MPKASPLFIDFLTLTLHIQEVNRKELVDAFTTNLPEFLGTKTYPNGGGYQYSRKIFIDGHHVLIQIQPTGLNAEKKNFLRIEWNPNKVPTHEIVTLVNCLLPDLYSDLLAYGVVTRVDLTTDIKNLPIWLLWMRYPGIWISYLYFKVDKETEYLGAKGGVLEVKAYNKRNRIKYLNSKINKMYHELLPPHNTTRIEIVFRPQKAKAKVTLQNLEAFCRKRYKKLVIGMVKNKPPEPKNHEEERIHAVFTIMQLSTLTKALRSVVKDKRKEVREYVAANTCTQFWDPEKLFDTFPNAIEHIVNPPPPKWGVEQKCNQQQLPIPFGVTIYALAQTEEK